MKIIDIKKEYKEFFEDQTDMPVEVSDQVADLFEQDRKKQNADKAKKYYHHAQYSLDSHPAVMLHVKDAEISLEEMIIIQEQKEEIYAAIMSLPEKQAKRIYAYYYLGMSKTQIARQEQVNESAVRKSIAKGLKTLSKYLTENI